VIPFSFRCATCQAPLRVTSAAALGLILPCPKCGSMVEVVEPDPVDRPGDGVDMENSGTTESSSTMPPDGVINDAPQPPEKVVGPPSPSSLLGRIAASGARGWLPIAGATIAVALVGGGIWWTLSNDDSEIGVAYTSSDTVKPPASPVPADHPTATNATPHGEQSASQPQPSAEQPAAPADTPASAGQGSEEPAGNEPAAQSDTSTAPPQAPARGAGQSAPAGNPDLAAAKPSNPDPSTNAPAGAPQPLPPAAQIVRKPSLVLDDLPQSLLEPSSPLSTQSIDPSSATAADSAAPNIPLPPDEPAEGPEPLRRVAFSAVDVNPRLATAIASVDIDNAPLHRAVESLASLTGVPASLDVDAIQAAGVRLDQPLSFHGHSLPIADIFKQTLGPIGLEAKVLPGQLLIAPANSGQSRKAKYAVDDLVRPGDPPIQELAELVRTVIRPSPAANGPPLDLSVSAGTFDLVATEIEHDRIIELCEKLRVARGRPLRSRYSAQRPDPRFDPLRFELASRQKRAQPMLKHRITAGIGRPAPLREVVRFLTAQSGVTIVLDAHELAELGMAVETEARVAANDEPLGDVLLRLLAPLGLTYRSLGTQMLEITTSKALAESRCLEFYPVRGMDLGADSADQRFQSYRDQLLKAAGVNPDSAVVYYDRPSQCLIVSAAYPDQFKLEQALQERLTASD
jgi:hypothetical protein